MAYEVIDFAEAMGDMTTMQAPMEFLLRGLATPEAIAKAIEAVSDQNHQLFSETGPPRPLGTEADFVVDAATVYSTAIRCSWLMPLS